MCAGIGATISGLGQEEMRLLGGPRENKGPLLAGMLDIWQPHHPHLMVAAVTTRVRDECATGANDYQGPACTWSSTATNQHAAHTTILACNAANASLTSLALHALLHLLRHHRCISSVSHRCLLLLGCLRYTRHCSASWLALL